ncbi:SH3 and PX domain-containing protein 2B [Mactra antiquata]
MVRLIENIEVIDVEKRKIPSKHYVYIIHVEWSDKCTNVIYRRYSRFFDFQSQLMDMFPEEAGAMDPSRRIIPFLPGKKFFGRSHIREVALKRMGPIAEYCKQIVSLPPKISQCRDVLEFFELDPDDIDPPKGRRQSIKAKKISQPKPLEVYIAVTEYKKQEKGEVTLHVGMLVEIVEKTESGWWFVNIEDEQGWVPSTCLEREDGVKEDTSIRFAPGEEEQYLCTEEFKGATEDELSMEKGAVVDVIEKNLEGWWFVRYNGQEGYVPATYLIKSNNVKIRKNDFKNNVTKSEVTSSGPVIVKTLSDVSELLQSDSETSGTVPSMVHNGKLSVPVVTTSTASDTNSDDDFDDDYDVPDMEEIYSIQELSKILKEDKKGSKETQMVVESLQSMKSRSLKRCGSSRPPPRPSAMPNHSTDHTSTNKVNKPSLVRCNTLSQDYVTIAAFSDVVGDGISFDEGQSVKVLEKNESGWWYVEIDGQEGWAPATYIDKGNSNSDTLQTVIEKPKAVTPPRSSSPQIVVSPPTKKKSPVLSGSHTDSDEDVGHGRKVSLGNLTNALKSRLKSNKSPPTLPKKDFLNENDDDVEKGPSPPKSPSRTKSTFGSVQQELSNGGGVNIQALKQGLKKSADRSMQPPPPAPPVPVFSDKVDQKTGSHKPLPPVPPGKGALKPPPSDSKPKPPSKPLTDHKPTVDTSEESKPSPFNVVLKHAGGPSNIGTKPPENKPKPKPMVPIKKDNHSSEVTTKHTPMVPVKKDIHSSNASTKPTLPIKHDTKPAIDNKPKFPVKNKSPERSDNEIGKVDVSGLAGALKAKFEAGNTSHTAGNVEKPKPVFGTAATTSSKPSKPTSDKPIKTVKPSLASKPGLPSSGKPSFVKNNIGSPPQNIKHLSTSSTREPGNEATNVSALANMLKAKLENKPTNEPSTESVPPRLHQPSVTTSKSPTRNLNKPQRPSTPPSKRAVSASSAAINVRLRPTNRSSSPSHVDPNLDPQKYSARPLPPAPAKSPNADQHKKPLPTLPSKPKANNAGVHSDNLADTNVGHVDVSNLANALKAKLGGVHNDTDNTTSTNITKSRNGSSPVESTQNQGYKPDNEDNDRNNNDDTESENVYYAVADFDGSNAGEIRLVSGQYYCLLETADDWWYVLCGNEEGWAPSTYLEKVNSSSSVSSGNKSTSESTGNKLKSQQNMYTVCTDFDAENDGELSVKQGELVEVLEMPEGGWWFVKTGHNEGWVPASFISE